jgi:predicted membrane-bound spermidine synthase
MTMRPQSDAFLFSASRIAPNVQLDQALMTIDAEADTVMYRFSGNPREMDFLKFDATALAYYIRHQGRSAVIGIGGGRDLWTASTFGFRDITGIDYNPIFARLLAHDYGDFSGAGKIPGLRLIVDDARSWLARSDEQFDLIQMSMIDSWAGTTAGAFTLSANPLYTVNGWKRFVARLTPNGVLTVSRWFHPEHPDEAARILSLAMATLMEMGEPKPAEHLYLAANGRLSTLIVGRAPLSMSDLQTLDETVRRLQYETLAAPNRVAADPVLERILHAATVDELIRIGRDTPLNLAPTWDANPFFFNQLRLPNPTAATSRLHAALRESGVLHGNLNASLTLLTLVITSMVVVVMLIIVPAMSSTRQSSASVTLWSSAYFLLIGMAFMFVEITLILRMSLLLGHPIYSLAIVLFSVILATGVGSLLSDRAVPLSVGALVGWPLVLAVYLGLLPLWWGKLADVAETGPLIERASVCLTMIVPAGVLMGFMFPTGMRLCTRIDPRITPWLWAVNGAGGVLASGAVVLVSINTSLNHSLWVGAVAYALLAVVGPRLFKEERATEDNPSPRSPGTIRFTPSDPG